MTTQDQTILIVDDDMNVRETIRDLLVMESISVRIAGPEEDLLAILRDEPIGVVVTDLNMPERDGLDVLRLVHAEGERQGRTIPVFVLTGAGGEARLEQIRQEGATGCFPKPFDLDEFVTRMREALGASADCGA